MTILLMRLSLDLVMFVLILFAFAYRLTGNSLHEVIGGGLLVLVLTHTVLSRRWYIALGKGKTSIGRVITLLLLAATLLLFVSGIANSRLLFPTLKAGSLLRQIHVWAAYWMLVLGSAHMGLHWDMVINTLSKRIDVPCPVAAPLLRATASILVCYGLYASIERDIFLKLAGYYSFDYWDFGRSIIGFFAMYLAIASIYVCLGHFAIRLSRKKHHESSGN